MELKAYGQPNVVIALAANKCDLEDYRVVSRQEGEAYAHENEMSYFETSAKSAHNVRQLFVELGASPPVATRRHPSPSVATRRHPSPPVATRRHPSRCGDAGLGV